MKTFLIFLFIFHLIPIWLTAQNTKSKVHIKYYSHIHYEDEFLGDIFGESTQALNFGRFSKAISLVNERGHFIEISPFTIKGSWNFILRNSRIRSTSGFSRLPDHFNFSFRLEKSWRLISNDNQKYAPYIGLSLQPYIDYYDAWLFAPLDLIYDEIVTIGGYVYLTPRFLIHLNQRFFFDTNLSFRFIHFSYQNYLDANVFSPVNFPDNTYGLWNYQLFQPNFQLRIGFGVKL